MKVAWAMAGKVLEMMGLALLAGLMVAGAIVAVVVLAVMMCLPFIIAGGTIIWAAQIIWGG